SNGQQKSGQKIESEDAHAQAPAQGLRAAPTLGRGALRFGPCCGLTTPRGGARQPSRTPCRRGVALAPQGAMARGGQARWSRARAFWFEKGQSSLTYRLAAAFSPSGLPARGRGQRPGQYRGAIPGDL